jgi:hypothetical protein
MRHAALRNGRSRRKDIDQLRAAVGRAEVFLNSYPYASDDRVLAWCVLHRWDAEMIVPGTMIHLRKRLLGDAVPTPSDNF